MPRVISCGLTTNMSNRAPAVSSEVKVNLASRTRGYHENAISPKTTDGDMGSLHGPSSGYTPRKLIAGVPLDDTTATTSDPPRPSPGAFYDDDSVEDWADNNEDGVADLTKFLSSIPEKAHHVITRWNGSGTRALRITQRELTLTTGNRIITSIEVVQADDSAEGATSVFAVKHSHGTVWRKQAAVHKNLLMASCLAGVTCPIELPEDSIKIFNTIENKQHVQIYLERMIPHFRFRNLPREVSAFWWRAVAAGSLIFQNWVTGRLLILVCEEKGIPKGAQTLKRGLDMLQNMPQNFWTLDPEYDQIKFATQGESDGDSDSMRPLNSVEEVAEAIQSWALEDGVSPWMTKLIVKSVGSRKGQIIQYRYSIGVDTHNKGSGHRSESLDRCATMQWSNPGERSTSAGNGLLSQSGATSPMYMRNSVLNSGELNRTSQAQGGGESGDLGGYNKSGDCLIFLTIQVHSNEPLSRELKAYPVCMIPVMLDSFDLKNLTTIYLKSLWFLRKLFEFHVEVNKSFVKERQAKLKSEPLALNEPAFIRTYKQSDEKDITYKTRLIGGARLNIIPKSNRLS